MASQPWKSFGVYDDEGFGLVEVMVSLMLFALLFAAFAPLLVGSLQFSAKSASMATSSQVANRQIELARGAATGEVAGTGCVGLQAFLNVPAQSTTDSRGRTYTVAQTASTDFACPGGSGTIPYWVTVTASGPNAAPPVTISTEIWVSS